MSSSLLVDLNPNESVAGYYSERFALIGNVPN